MACSPGPTGLRWKALAAGMCAVVALGVQVTSGTAVAAPSARSISAAEIIARGSQWVGQQVPYGKHASFRDLQGHRYRTDCSGFISMAWALGTSLTTRSLPQVAKALGPVGDYRQLHPGDMLDSTSVGHAVLFVRWADRRHTTAVIMEEAHPGTAARVDSTYYTTSLLSGQSFVAYRYDKLAPPATATDLNVDGLPDVIARRAGDGTLWLFRGTRGGGLAPGRLIATGWARMKMVVEVADFDGDGHPDLLAAHQDGTLWYYSAEGRSGSLQPHRIAGNWNPRDMLVSAGDFDGAGYADVLARRADGTLWLYRGDGAGGLGVPRRVDWHGNRLGPILALADYNGDGYPDVLSRHSDDTLWVSLASGQNRWGVPTLVTHSIPLISGAATTTWRADFAAMDDLDRTGEIGLLKLARLGPVAGSLLMSAHGQDGDVLVRRADGTLWLSRADRHSGFLAPQLMPGDWAQYDLVL